MVVYDRFEAAPVVKLVAMECRERERERERESEIKKKNQQIGQHGGERERYK